MNVDITRGYDSFFGPPSDPISIRKFLDDSNSLVFPSASNVLDHTGWQSLSETERAAVEAECSENMAELKTAVKEVWDNPMFSAHLYRAHAAAVNAVYDQTGVAAPKGRKRKYLPDPEEAEAQPEVRALEEKLKAIPLQCWGLNRESAYFMRTSRHSDFNALKCVKRSGPGVLTCDRPSSSSPHPTAVPNESRPRRDALITLTVHNRVSWIHSQLTRFSQHVVLSSQTLADVVRVIPCDSSEMPNETVDNDNVVGYAYTNSGDQDRETAVSDDDEGCLLLIEDVVYGDGRPGDDYADKLLSHLHMLPEEKRPHISKSPTSLSQTPFASLTLRINQPYWMLHQGNCEHFIVIDRIKLAHPLDLPSGYPLTVHITSTLGDVCKGCAKVPAVLSIVGDIRLGESPCLLCAPCWNNMGPPREEESERVMVVPLVRYHNVWKDV